MKTAWLAFVVLSASILISSTASVNTGSPNNYDPWMRARRLLLNPAGSLWKRK